MRTRDHAVQLDLFGEMEAEEQRAEGRRAWDATPQTCPFCGEVEPSGFLLNINHTSAAGPDHDTSVRYTSECMAMYLTRNHILFFADQPEDRGQGQLARVFDRACEVWQHYLDRLAASLAEHGEDLDALRARVTTGPS